MIKWDTISNAEIRKKMESMTLEYEGLKNRINKLIEQMDNLDIEYNKAIKEIEKRSKK